MKRFLAVVIIFGMIFSVFSCDAFDDDNISGDMGKNDASEYIPNYILHANYTGDERLNDLALNKDSIDRSKHYPIYKISNINELTDFRMSGLFGIFHRICDNFTEDFFSKNDLLVVYVISASSSYRFGLDDVVIDGENLCINIKRVNAPQFCEDAMDAWLVLIPMSKHTTSMIKSYNSEFVGVKLQDEGREANTPNLLLEDIKGHLINVGYRNDERINELALNDDLVKYSKCFPIYKVSNVDEYQAFQSLGFFSVLNSISENYTEVFFKTHDLLIVYIDSSSISHTYGIDTVTVNNGNLCVNIKPTNHHGGGYNALDGWIATIQISKEISSKATSYNSVFVEAP